ncbi:alpha-E domain-containing protein [Dinoroseobacter sp. PD6]|uniref:alpha-E domain-containing protein n=1 Tax=Dinoroseobacter sp. PD6 TaxID=3028384 RepID=UPI00237BA3D2|nr:alpha-E domain-containing protein [Dinoroseobacter sp. PD6]MDD9717904.1 alpha-E domain-containing protein [Dinoroseobacter sp. PD6]
MLGKTAGGLFWMFRYLERSENIARLVDAGQRIALTRSDAAASEWGSILATAGARDAYLQKYDAFEGANAVDFLLRDKDNPSSVMSVISSARDNARLVRTALTREVWEAVNECYLTLRKLLARKISERDLPDVLGIIRQRSVYVRGALHGTMMRNDIYDFARIGTFLERADNTARILDVKYYVLLPSANFVGSSLDNVQWETILRSVSGEGAFRHNYGSDSTPADIAEFLILDRRMPRSLAFCYSKISANLGYLEADYGDRHPCHDTADAVNARIRASTVDLIFEGGLHEFIQDFLRFNAMLGQQIEQDYRFYG